MLFSDGYFTYQARHPRFQAENMNKNKNLYDRVENLAKKHEATPPQLALAWVLQQGEDVVPIPGECQRSTYICFRIHLCFVL